MKKLQRHVLTTLEANSRMSVREICQQVNASRSTVYATINHLQKTGIIRKFTIERGDIGDKECLKAYILIAVQSGEKCIKVINQLRHCSGIAACEYLYGHNDILITARVKNNQELSRLRLDIERIKQVESAETTIVQKLCF